MKHFKALAYIIPITLLINQIGFAGGPNQTSIKQVANLYNSNRMKPGAALEMMAQSSLDKKFIKEVTKGVKELPLATLENEKIVLKSNNKKHTFEKINSEKNSYLIDGVLFQDKPFAMLKTRYESLQKAMQKRNAGIMSLILPEANAQGWETAAAFIALFSLMGWMGYNAHELHQADQICDLAKNHLSPMIDEVTNRKAVKINLHVDIELQSEATQTEIKHLTAFHNECGAVEPSDNERWQHCSEIATRVKCTLEVLNEYFPEMEKAEKDMKKSGENMSEWDKGGVARSQLKTLMESVQRDSARILGTSGRGDLQKTGTEGSK